jgi:hypothetical protein
MSSAPPGSRTVEGTRSPRQPPPLHRSWWALVVSNHRPPPCKGHPGDSPDQRRTWNHSRPPAVMHLNASRRFASFFDLSRNLCGISSGLKTEFERAELADRACAPSRPLRNTGGSLGYRQRSAGASVLGAVSEDVQLVWQGALAVREADDQESLSGLCTCSSCQTGSVGGGGCSPPIRSARGLQEVGRNSHPGSAESRRDSSQTRVALSKRRPPA